MLRCSAQSHTSRVLVLIGFLVLMFAGSGAAAPLPELIFDGPPQSAALAERLRTEHQDGIQHILDVVGLEDPGPPIRVVLAQDDSPEARRAPSWGVGYAIGEIGLVVLLVDRLPGYPDRSIDETFLHEIAHVMISRAALRRPVPRWFNEGLAIHAAREWRLDDRGRVMIATLKRDSLSLGHIDRHFHAGATSAARAYALSAAFVRDMASRYDDRVFARIFDRMRLGEPFPEAFFRSTGIPLHQAEAEFWRHLDLWNRWIPFLTSSATLWILITILAVYAFKRRREKDAEKMEEWEAEENRWLESEPTDGWVN